MAERLWVCHPCSMIGDQAAAERHVELKGHAVEQLDQETSDAVRAEWAASGEDRSRHPLVVASSLTFPRKDHTNG